MPDLKVNDINKLIEEAENAVREGAYVTVGLGVLAYQRAQVRRRELVKLLDKERSGSGSQLSSSLQGITSQVKELSSQLSTTGEKFTGQFGDLSKTINSNVDSAREQLADLAKTVDGWVAPARRQIDQGVDAIEDLLPSSARNVFSQVKSAAATPETRLRSAVGLDERPAKPAKKTAAG